MPLFHYTGRNSDNALTIESLSAPSIEEARKILDARRAVYFNLIEEEKVPLLQWQSISIKNVLFFTRYFSVLIKAGVSIFKSLSILEKQEKNPSFRQKIRIMREEIESGKNLFQAFKRFESLFSPFYCSLIRIGEETGKLHEILERLADYIEKNRDVRRKLLSVMIYPAIVSFIILAISLFLFTYIVPTFANLYWQLGLTLDKLPMITKIMLAIGDFIKRYLVWEVVILILTLSLLYEFYHTRAGRLAIDDTILKLPLIKEISLQYNMSIFCRHLSVLFASGYTVLRSFDMALETISNQSLKLQMTKIISSLEAGRGIAESFREVPIVPILTIEMVEIGEETASFDRMLLYLAEFYEKEIDLLSKTFISLIEPMLIIILGIIVLLVLLAIYLPIFKLAAEIRVV
ncbi:MAG: type II secretion system F family protein [Candidatus Wallbacteria bacterium]|nr:type II secretion system F family protein [Candidatus Wallbacteria bacterium]